MALIKCLGCDAEVSDRVPAGPTYDAPGPAAAPSLAQPVQRHKTHPVTWLIVAALIPPAFVFIALLVGCATTPS
jgi:hypothetical protein